MKSYTFFKIYKRLNKERQKALMQQSMRKEKLREVGICFITDCFLKPFKMIINLFFYFASSFAAQFLLFVCVYPNSHSFFNLKTKNEKLISCTQTAVVKYLK